MTRVHYGHVFHVAGRPDVGGAAAALTEIPDGALAIDDSGRITFCGNRSEFPAELSSAVGHDHRAGFLLPGFVDTHIHFPQTYAGDSYGGGQLLEWLDQCIFPSESRFANPEFATRAAAGFCDRRIAAGTTAAMVFGSAFPHAQDALFTGGAYDGRFLPGSVVGGASLLGTDFGGGDEWLIPRVLGSGCDALHGHAGTRGQHEPGVRESSISEVYVRGQRVTTG
jgi:hypothetical protein